MDQGYRGTAVPCTSQDLSPNHTYCHNRLDVTVVSATSQGSTVGEDPTSLYMFQILCHTCFCMYTFKFMCARCQFKKTCRENPKYIFVSGLGILTQEFQLPLLKPTSLLLRAYVCKRTNLLVLLMSLYFILFFEQLLEHILYAYDLHI